MTTGFDPSKSRVSVDSMATFLGSPLVSDLKSVPGVGPSAKEKLAAVGIYNTFQLLGKCLMLFDPDAESTKGKHAENMWQFLASIGINSYRSGITLALTEKLETMSPGSFKMSHMIVDE